jgi:hypothetical protein
MAYKNQNVQVYINLLCGFVHHVGAMFPGFYTFNESTRSFCKMAYKNQNVQVYINLLCGFVHHVGAMFPGS